MKTFKTLLFLSFLFLFSKNGFSQLGISSYNFSVLAVGFNYEKPVSAELKLFANLPLELVVLELDAFYNFKPKTWHRFSIGVGINAQEFVPLQLVFPLQLEVYPLQNLKNLSLLFELSPGYEFEYEPIVRYMWGFRYLLDSKKE
ncbi:MAG: hypothetical protein R2879_07800 [Saprospiraceae bacterium]